MENPVIFGYFITVGIRSWPCVIFRVGGPRGNCQSSARSKTKNSGRKSTGTNPKPQAYRAVPFCEYFFRKTLPCPKQKMHRWSQLVGGLEHVLFFHIGNNHPIWRTHIFQRGRSTTNQYYWHYNHYYYYIYNPIIDDYPIIIPLYNPIIFQRG